MRAVRELPPRAEAREVEVEVQQLPAEAREVEVEPPQLPAGPPAAECEAGVAEEEAVRARVRG